VASAIYLPAQTYKDDSLCVREILNANGLDSIPVEDVSSVQDGRIYSLYLSSSALDTLPDCVGNLTALHNISLSGNVLTALPHTIGSLINLTDLNISDNQLRELPEEFSRLEKLTYVYFIRNQFTQWPEVFNTMPNLKSIDVGGNHLTEVPAIISTFQKLTNLYINDNYLTELPPQFSTLDLDVVHVAGNALCTVSEALVTWLGERDYYKEDAKWRTYQRCGTYIQDSSKVRSVLDSNALQHIPVGSVVTVIDDNIVAIDLSQENILRTTPLAKRLTTALPVKRFVLPEGLEYLKHLRSLNLAGNNIDTLPKNLLALCHLRQLDLSKNRLTTLPDFITAFSALDSLDLSGNSITKLPVNTEAWATTHDPNWKTTQQTTASFGTPSNRTPHRGTILSITQTSKQQLQFAISLPVPAQVVVSVYSLSGRKYSTTTLGYFSAGSHRILQSIPSPGKGTFIATLTVQGSSTSLPFMVN